MTVKELLIKFQEYQLEYKVLNANCAHNAAANLFMERYGVKNCSIPDVMEEVPTVRVRHYNEETGETEDGTVIDATLNTYLVIPDYNLSMTVRWDKVNCDVLR